MEIQSIKNRFGIIGNSPALNFALQVAGGTSTELGVGRILAGVIQFSKKLSDVNPSESASRTSDDQGL